MSGERFKQTCPRKLEHLPTRACPLALEALDQMKHGKKAQEVTLACPWAVNNPDAGYCFWKQLDLDNGPYETEEVSKLLHMSEEAVRVTGRIAVDKLKEIGESEEMTLFRQAIQDVVDSKHIDPTIYEACDTIGDLLRQANPGSGDDDDNIADVEKTLKKPEKSRSTAAKGFAGDSLLHHSGKRTNIYGLSKKGDDIIKGFQKNGKKMVWTKNTMLEETAKRKEKDDKPEKKKNSRKKNSSQTPTS